MAKQANPGEMRTPIAIMVNRGEGQDADGYPISGWENVFGEGVNVYCKWVSVHGRDVYDAATLELQEPATLTLRYSPAIDQRCRVLKRGDPAPYEIISMNNVLDRGEWLELTVKRMVSAI